MIRSGKVLRLVLVLAAAAVLVSCSPYASLNVGVPINVGGAYISPSIGIGFPL